MSSVKHLLNKLRGPIQSVPTSADVVVRYARPADADALAKLAQLDSRPVPQGNVIVADVQGELWAAVSVDDGHAVATPFRPSGELTYSLIERARKLRGDGGQGWTPRRPRRRARVAVA